MTERMLAAIVLLGLASCRATDPASPPAELGTRAPREDAAPQGITLAWDKNMLSIRAAFLPAGKVDVWYLEAFCRPGSTGREWGATVIPHHTEKVEASPDGKRIRLRSQVERDVEVTHEIVASDDTVDFQLTATNSGRERAEIAWAQPCIRVGEFTGKDQAHYIERCFIFVDGVLTTLDKIPREEEALYRGGQVYVPAGIDRADVNPRPLSRSIPSNGLIGCFSADGKWILATAWEPFQELFQGVIVCIHSDFRLGGLEPGETRTAKGKIYLVENDPEKLLRRYVAEFGGAREP